MCVLFPPKGVHKKPEEVLFTGKGVMALNAKWVGLY